MQGKKIYTYQNNNKKPSTNKFVNGYGTLAVQQLFQPNTHAISAIDLFPELVEVLVVLLGLRGVSRMLPSRQTGKVLLCPRDELIGNEADKLAFGTNLGNLRPNPALWKKDR